MKITNRSIDEAIDRRRKYGFDRLKVGQCLELKIYGDGERQALRSSASYFGKRHGMDLAVRKIANLEDSSEAWLYGVWRLA